MPSTTSEERRAAEERAEREEMFSFHPDILTEPAPLPRKSDGSGYSAPTDAGLEP